MATGQLVAHLISYRLKNPVGQGRTMPAMPAAYETRDTAAVLVALAKTFYIF